MELLKGYYAVGTEFVFPGKKVNFTYKGKTYEVIAGENYFTHGRDAMAMAEKNGTIPTEKIYGVDYLPTTPTVLFSAGTFVQDGDGMNFNVTILGAGAGVLPFIDGKPNIEWEKEKTVFMGLEHHGVFWFFNGSKCTDLYVDGVELNYTRFNDVRTDDGKYKLTFKNIKHVGDSRWNVFEFQPLSKDGFREVYFENLFLDDCFCPDCDKPFFLSGAEKLTIKNMLCQNTDKIFGLTNFNGAFKNVNHGKKYQVLFEDCTFSNISSIQPTAITAKNGEIDLTFNNVKFINASKKEAPVFELFDFNDANVSFNGCTLVDDRSNASAFIRNVNGKANITFNDTVVDGFKTEKEDVSPKPLDRSLTPTDPHETLCFDDYKGELESLYKGKKVYFGDMHAHSNSGGVSDGHCKLSDWPEKMKKVGVDFAAIVDHEQMRQMFLPEFNNNLFLCGSEPGCYILGLNKAIKNEIHFIMLFPDKYGMKKVVEAFQLFMWHGDELTGSMMAPYFSKELFTKVIEKVEEVGGVMIIPHPKQILISSDPFDYYFKDDVLMETLYDKEDSFLSKINYELWVTLLNAGKRIRTSSGSDTHDDPVNDVLCAIYSEDTFNGRLFNYVKTGQLTAGSFGIKMALNGAVMGSVVKAKDGDVLILSVADSFKGRRKDGELYELRIYTEKGLAYSKVFDGTPPVNVALKIKDRAYYRADVYNLTNDHLSAVGNPIWIEK